MIFKRIQEDIDAIVERDPAARSRLEVWLCYSGLHALIVYRLSNALWRRKWFLAARFVSQIGRLLTGVEIHPGARIGRRLVIDHGNGLVIGETSEIGENVTLYHGVTLGGIAPSVEFSHAEERQTAPDASRRGDRRLGRSNSGTGDHRQGRAGRRERGSDQGCARRGHGHGRPGARRHAQGSNAG